MDLLLMLPWEDLVLLLLAGATKDKVLALNTMDLGEQVLVEPEDRIDQKCQEDRDRLILELEVVT